MINPKLRIALIPLSLIFITQLLWLLNHGFDEFWYWRLLAGPLAAGLAGYVLCYIPEYFWGHHSWFFWEYLDNWVMRPRITTACIILLTILVYVYCAAGHFHSTDDEFRYRGTKAILEHGNVLLYHQDDGTPVYCKYGVLQLVLTIPLYLAGQNLADVLPPGYEWPIVFSTSLMQIVSALACGMVFLTCLEMGYSRWVSLSTALIVAFATITWPYSKHFFSEPLTGTLMLAAFWQLMRFKYRRLKPALAFSGLCVGLAGLNTPQVFLLYMPLIGIYLLYLLYPRPNSYCANWRQFCQVLLCFCIPLGMCILAQMGYNYHRYDTPFSAGYVGDRGYPSIVYDGAPGWSLAWWVGLQGYLFSSGKSMFLYSPVLVLSVVAFNQFFKRNRHEAVLLIFTAILWLGFHSKWWAWHGDSAWGPRFTVPITLLWCLPLAEAISWWPRRGRAFRLILIGLVLFGAVVQFGGIAIPFDYYMNQVIKSPDYAEQFLLHYVPHFSPVLGHWENLLDGVRPDFMWLGKPIGSWLMVIAVVLLNILLGAAVSRRLKASHLNGTR